MKQKVLISVVTEVDTGDNNDCTGYVTAYITPEGVTIRGDARTIIKHQVVEVSSGERES